MNANRDNSLEVISLEVMKHLVAWLLVLEPFPKLLTPGATTCEVNHLQEVLLDVWSKGTLPCLVPSGKDGIMSTKTFWADRRICYLSSNVFGSK